MNAEGLHVEKPSNAGSPRFPRPPVFATGRCRNSTGLLPSRQQVPEPVHGKDPERSHLLGIRRMLIALQVEQLAAGRQKKRDESEGAINAGKSGIRSIRTDRNGQEERA